MKKLLFILLIASLKLSAQPATPTGYNFINSKYDWLEGKFRTLHIPSGGATPTLYNGWTGAGAVYWDSVGKKFYIWDGAAWGQITGGGGVTSVATTAPITGGTITTTGTIGITQSGAGANGYLSSTDWNTFNNKAPTITVGTFTQRLALSPSNGTEFFQTNDGRDAPAGRYFYLDTLWKCDPLTEEDFWYYFTDFSGQAGISNGTASYGFLKAGTLGAGSFVSFSGGNEMFYGNFGTGTTTTGFAKLGSDDGNVTANTGLRASKVNLYFKTTIQSISQKANQTDNFTIDAGFSNTTTGAVGIGYLFRYDSTTSANWLYKNGSGGFTSTGIAVSAATPYKLETLVRSDSVFYWINNSQVAAEATSSNTTFLQPLLRILKSLGTTGVTMTVDYIKIWARLQATQTR